MIQLYISIHLFFFWFFSIIGYCIVLDIVLYSRSLLFTYFVCSSVYLLIPDSKFITSPFGIHKVVFSMSLLLFCAMLCWVAHSCPTLCDPMDRGAWWPTVHGDSPGKSTGVGFHALLQGIFLTQGSNPGLLLCRWVLDHLSHQGSPSIL